MAQKSFAKSNSTKVSNASNTKGGKRLMIDDVDFKITNWSHTEIDFENDMNKNGNQFSCFGRYNYGKESSPVQNQLVFKTGPLKLVTYGIPPLGNFAKTDKDRSHIKIPYDTSQESFVNLFKMFEALDSWAIKNKDKFFTGKLGKFSKLYDYTPIVRKPQEVIAIDDDDNADSTKQTSNSSERPMYAKIKISTDWKTGEVDTTVFLREDGVPIKQEVKTITDIASLVTWQSTIQMICSCTKLWFGKSADKTGRRQYGIGFKILQCEVIEKLSGGPKTKSDFTTYAFDDTMKIEEKSEEKKKVAKAEAKAETKAEAEDEDSLEDSDSDEEDTKQDTKQDTKAKPATIQDSDDDSDDDEPKPATKQDTKQETKQDTKQDSDDSEDDSEEEKPAPKQPPPKAKTVKKVAKSGK